VHRAGHLRLDVNKAVRKRMGVKRASFASAELTAAREETR